MTDRLKIALAQLNPIMGDIEGNLRLARDARAKAKDADIILFAELFIVGYPPEDLVLKPALQEDARAAIEAFAKDTIDGGPAVLIGAPWVDGGKLYNAVLLLEGGKVAGAHLQSRSAELRRVRREARVRAGAVAGAVQHPRRAHRHSHLRRHLDARRRRMPVGNRRRDPARAERFAVRSRQGRCAPQSRRRARGGSGPAAHLSQPGGRAGRTRVRRRLAGRQRGSFDRLGAAVVGRTRRRSPSGRRRTANGCVRRARNGRAKTAIPLSITP